MTRHALVSLLRRRLTTLTMFMPDGPMLRIEKEHAIQEALDEIEPLEGASPPELLAYATRMCNAFLYASQLIDSSAYTPSQIEVFRSERDILLERNRRVADRHGHIVWEARQR